MTQQEFFDTVLDSLEELGISYMVSGSVGAMLFGEPRMTNDMDVIVELSPAHAERLARAFGKDAYYCPPPESIRGEIACRGQFNILHPETGSKVDLIIRKDTDFARLEFSRRFSLPVSAEAEWWSATPEDIIVSKLTYFQTGESEKHLRDIRGILAVSGKELDLGYIGKWVNRLGLEDIWRQAQE